MKRIHAWVLVGLFCAFGLQNWHTRTAAASFQQTRQPNVVLIMMDDLGYGDLASYGARDVRTPATDRLVRGGVRFTNSYANGAVCTPSRAALITGRYQQRVGLEWVLGESDVGLAVSPASLPALLKKSGYATALVGKWHLGYTPETGPNAHGFDEFFGLHGGVLDYYTHTGVNGRPDLFENTTPTKVDGYMTDVITERAVRFIDRQAASPFFLEVAYTATHTPFQPPDDLPADALRPRRPLGEMPGDPGAHTRQDYVRMLERADSGVGEILRALDRHGLGQNTLVIFTSDNGGEWLSRNDPFSSRKGSLWEGGIRVPLILSWPERLPAGKTSDQVATTMDLTASILSATGTAAASGHPLDGINLIPILRGDAPVVSRDLFWRIARPGRVQRAIRSGGWKLLIDGDTTLRDLSVPHVMLFDLGADPGERHDVAKDHPARVTDLRARFGAWETAVWEMTPEQVRTYIDVVIANATAIGVAGTVRTEFMKEQLQIAESSTVNAISSVPTVTNPNARNPFIQVYRADLTPAEGGAVRVRLSGTGQNGNGPSSVPRALTSALVSRNPSPNETGWRLLERVATRLRGSR